MIKYLTTELLLEANEAANRENRNRKYDSLTLKDSLPIDGIFFVSQECHHGNDEMRLGILINEDDVLYLDMSKLRYESLPVASMNEKGEVILEEEESWLKRRPYPNRREWSEKKERKTVRDSSFAKRVKETYKNQCAMCSVATRSVLIAAHIVPVKDGGTDDTSNGLCLCRNHDSLYENGEILVDQNGKIIKKPPGSNVEFTHIRFPEQEENAPSSENLLFRLKMQKDRP